MIMARGTACLGSWSFFDDHAASATSAAERWQRVLRSLSIAASLAEHEQLIVYPIEAALVERDHGVSSTVAVGVACQDDLEATLQELAARRHADFCSVELRSDALVRAPRESRRLRDVFGLECNVRSWNTWLTAWTRADIWLPYDLFARPQPAIARLNEPRLPLVLAGIALAMGTDGFSEDSRFARVEGHRLFNHVVNGHVLDLQDMGYDEAWIVERWPDEADR